MRMSYNNRTRSQRSVCKRAISNRRNTRRKVNPRTGWSTGTHISFSPRCSRTVSSVRLSLARERVMRAGEPLLAGNTCRARCTARPVRCGPVRWYLYTYTYMCPHVHASLVCTYMYGKVHVSARTHTRAFTPANTYCRIYYHRVLYNAAIDSRPLFHARDLLQSLQPVSGDSLQCPVSLPVSVHKIYFPRRYTGCRHENRTRAPAARTENPARCAEFMHRIRFRE